MEKPKYFTKHPCSDCQTGYGECCAWWVISMRCCENCSHPTRWLPNPWTDEDLSEMKEILKRRG